MSVFAPPGTHLTRGPALDDMVQRDVEADLEEIRRPLPPASVSPDAIEQTFTQSPILKSKGFQFAQTEPGVWELSNGQQVWQVTFQPTVFEEKPSLRLLLWGDPVFEQLLAEVTAS